MKKLLSFCLIAAVTTFCAVNIKAADQKVTAADKAEKKGRPIPAQGKIDAIDKSAKTIKVGERTFQVVSDTRVIKAGKPATLDDAKVGDEVGISYREADGGKLELVSLRVGPKPEKKPKEEKK